MTPIFHAVVRGDIPILKFLVEEIKVSINHVEKCNRTPIYQACFDGNL